MKNNIIACGVPRTGSTLVWLILDNILGNKVQKRHPCSWGNTPCDFVVGSIRHPYDTVASAFRGRIVRDFGDGSPGTVNGTKKGLKQDINMTVNNFNQLKVLVDKYSGVILRYEDFFYDFNVIYDMVEDKLGVEVPAEKRKQLNKQYSFESSRKRNLELNPDGKRVDRMEVTHIAVGVPGTWKGFIPFWGYDCMKKYLNPICKEWGYEI